MTLYSRQRQPQAMATACDYTVHIGMIRLTNRACRKVGFLTLVLDHLSFVQHTFLFTIR